MADSSNMAEYMKNRRQERRQKASVLLGGKCNKCSCPDLGEHQFDHIDPKTKINNIADMLDCNWDIVLTELAKCQLLCIRCHKQKTLVDLNRNSAINTHGTLSSYRYCHCEECKAAKAQWMRDYRIRISQNN